MATSTLANSPDHHVFAAIALPFTLPTDWKSQPQFRVFPTGKAEYPWHIVASASNRTISRHKSLTFALRKCTWLNQQRGEGASHEIN